MPSRRLADGTVALHPRYGGLSDVAVMNACSQGGPTVHMPIVWTAELCISYPNGARTVALYAGDGPGQLQRCHAEKQVAAYLVRKHVVLNEDIEAVEGTWEKRKLGILEIRLFSSSQRVGWLRTIQPCELS